MKIQSTTPNPLFGISNNQLFNKKSIVSESIADIANMQERKDMYIPKNPVEDVSSDNAIYDQNGQLLNNSNKKKDSNEVNEEIDYSKINGIVTPTYSTIINGVETELREPTEEENRLFNLNFKLSGLQVKKICALMDELRGNLDTSRSYSYEELLSIYDKKNNTNSQKKLNLFHKINSQYNIVSNMYSALTKAIDAGKTRNDIMDFVTDNSFSEDDFDYIMNIADHYNYDIKDQKLTDKDVVNTENKNVSSDLQNVMKDLFS